MASPRWLRRPHFLAAVLVGGAAVMVLQAAPIAAPTRAILGFDCGGGLFLALTLRMMAGAAPERMRRAARRFDEGEAIILVVTLCAALFGLVAVVAELGVAKPDNQHVLIPHIILAAGSLVLSWTLTHTLFALRYAHQYYSDAPEPGTSDAAGLQFPGTAQPDYWDFMYFSFVVGMTCQTSDVNIANRGARRLALVHGALSFLFNTVILALAINLGASLI